MVLDISCQQFGGINFGGLYISVLDVSCKIVVDECKLDSSVLPLGAGMGYFHFKK